MRLRFCWVSLIRRLSASVCAALTPLAARKLRMRASSVSPGNSAMPFLQLIMRKQITFQSSYVNNAIEYQRFWDDGAIPHNAADEATWDRVSLRECLSFLGYSVATDAERQTLDADFERFRRKIVSCYATGDSFSYFVSKRNAVVYLAFPCNVIV